MKSLNQKPSRDWAGLICQINFADTAIFWQPWALQFNDNAPAMTHANNLWD